MLTYHLYRCSFEFVARKWVFFRRKEWQAVFESRRLLKLIFINKLNITFLKNLKIFELKSLCKTLVRFRLQRKNHFISISLTLPFSLSCCDSTQYDSTTSPHSIQLSTYQPKTAFLPSFPIDLPSHTRRPKLRLVVPETDIIDSSHPAKRNL